MKADNNKPVVTYPCTWEFKVIGFDLGLIREAITRAVGAVEYAVADSRQSSTGKYRSVTLALTVRDEAHRDGVFAALRDNKDVIMVI